MKRILNDTCKVCEIIVRSFHRGYESEEVITEYFTSDWHDSAIIRYLLSENGYQITDVIECNISLRKSYIFR